MSTERREPTFNPSSSAIPREAEPPRTERRDAPQKSTPHYTAPPPPPSYEPVKQAGKGLAVVGLLLALAGIAFAGFLFLKLTEAQKVLAQADARISGLEEQLSLTSEESTATVVTLQANLKKLDADLQKAAKQAETNRTALASATQKLTSAESGIAQLKKDTAGVVNNIAALKKDITTQKTSFDASVGKIDTVATAITQQQQQQQSLSDEIAKVRMEMVDVEAINIRMKKTEEAIKAIDDYRRTTNREILQIKQQINSTN